MDPEIFEIAVTIFWKEGTRNEFLCSNRCAFHCFSSIKRLQICRQREGVGPLPGHPLIYPDPVTHQQTTLYMHVNSTIFVSTK